MDKVFEKVGMTTSTSTAMSPSPSIASTVENTHKECIWVFVCFSFILLGITIFLIWRRCRNRPQPQQTTQLTMNSGSSGISGAKPTIPSAPPLPSSPPPRPPTLSKFYATARSHWRNQPTILDYFPKLEKPGRVYISRLACFFCELEPRSFFAFRLRSLAKLE